MRQSTEVSKEQLLEWVNSVPDIERRQSLLRDLKLSNPNLEGVKKSFTVTVEQEITGYNDSTCHNCKFCDRFSGMCHIYKEILKSKGNPNGEDEYYRHPKCIEDELKYSESTK